MDDDRLSNRREDKDMVSNQKEHNGRRLIQIMWSFGLAILVACMSLATARADDSTLDVVKKRGKVIVGVRYDTPPFGSVDNSGKVTGFDIDIAKYIASKLGVELELVQVTGQSRIPMLTSGRVDMDLCALSIFRSRLEAIDFTNPYFYDGGKVMVKKESDIRGYQDLDGKRVATAQGTPYEKVIAIAHPTTKVLSYQEYPQAVQAMKQGLADAMVTDSVILARLVGDNPDLKIVGDYFTMAPFAIGVRQNDSKWRNTLNVMLQNMWVEGKYQAAYQQYFGPQSKFPLPLGFKLEVWPD